MIVGVDEVGRGCWAGPLCVAAVILGDHKLARLTDSKKLTLLQREKLAAEIRNTAAAIGIGWVGAKAIDQHGLSKALTAATRQAIAQIALPIEEIIIDGTINFIKDPRVTTLPKADLLVPSVSAASIVAKVARDRYMRTLHDHFAVYQFDKHVGYGTPLHRQLLEEFGPSAIHRMSFSPMNGEAPKYMQAKIKTIDYSAGRRAEAAAAVYLQQQGFIIVEQNWRTRWCEIDIIAHKDDRLYFVEVKYRSKPFQGTGLDYITPQKLAQMRFAAEFWTATHNWQGQSTLAALEVSGKHFAVTAWLDTL